MEKSQFAVQVVNFSSQYGTAGTSSYTASNLAGSLRVYDSYGDFQEAFVLRTYGRWWQCCPSAAKKIKKVAETFRSQDFVELRYLEPVIPTGIDVYETYHPGAVVRILACNSTPEKNAKPGEVEWVTLWSGPPQSSQVPKGSRKFSPHLKKIDFPTNLIRLEFNSEECEYYTELDGVALRGHKPKPDHQDHHRDRAAGFQEDLTRRLLRQLSLSDRQVSIGDDEEDAGWGPFGMLPDELIQQILKYLDTVSLSNAAQTCSLLLKNAYDPLLYKELDLRSRWNTVDDVALQSLKSRCRTIQHIDLSWTGGGGQITEKALCGFLEECGHDLLTLRLACCKYVGKNCLATIGRVCTKLEELDLQSCLHLRESAFLHIGELSQLKRLNLYSVELTSAMLDTIGRKCPLLEHLNIGAVKVSQTFVPVNPMTTSLGECLKKLKNLVSLDLWRCRFATPDILYVIADNCHNLEELDIGWCHAIYNWGFDAEFCEGCTKLKKLFLTCGRSVSDRHLVTIAKFCQDLEQLDILGTGNVSEEGVTAVLKACPKLVFFDVSFCSRLTVDVVDRLGKQFPRVNFKKSFS